MVRSMTGYGRGVATLENLTATVEIKSVNHRFYECSVKAPRSFLFAEEKVKSFLKSGIVRGKVDVFVSLAKADGVSSGMSLNEAFIKEYLATANTIAKKFKVKNDVTVSTLLQKPDTFITENELSEEQLWQLLEEALSEALKMFVETRETEGEKLATDIISKCDYILEKVAEIEKLSPESEVKYRERLENKIKDLLQTKEVDEQRLLTEVAIFADKIAVDEETVRLRSHISQMKDLLSGSGSVGKKLDFIVQEMNREINTTGSKSQEIEISYIVVDLKAVVEKIREQIQNIE